MGKARTFRVNGLQLAALEWPGEGLPVIALHGWLDNAASFAPLAEWLPRHHLLALDLPGHGHSDHLPPFCHYHLADNLPLVSAVADAMGWQRFVLLGHSMGAAIACVAAAAMPHRVIGLSLFDGLGPVALTPPMAVSRLRQLFVAAGSEKPSRPFSDIATAAQARKKYSRFPISLAAARAITERNLRLEHDGYHWRFDVRLKAPSTYYYSEEQVLGLLHAVVCPTLLLSAEQGALQGWSGFAGRRAAVDGLHHQQLAGGHHLHMETPQPVAERLNGFLTRCWEERDVPD